MEVRKHAIRVLSTLGVPAKLHGFKYLADAIEMVYNDEYYSELITKRLYPDIAKRYDGCTPCTVERCIRSAIKKTKSKHTNTGFILSAVWFLRQLD